jgi:site-specific DNA-methyltransferase (adenine-specific)
MIKLMQGDCLERIKEIPDGSVDMILTDPPYGTTACKWDSIIPLEPMWEQLKRIIKPNGAMVLFGSEPFSSSLRMSNISDFKYDWVWNKVKGGNFAILNYQPYKIHEIISIFSKSTHNYYPIKTPQKERKGKVYSSSESAPLKYNDGKERVYKDKHPKSILEVSNANQKGKVHPTQKPVALMEYLIKTYTNEGETVLDFTMGSGTTGVASKNLNRSFIGIELDEGYFEIADKRIFNK